MAVTDCAFWLFIINRLKKGCKDSQFESIFFYSFLFVFFFYLFYWTVNSVFVMLSAQDLFYCLCHFFCLWVVLSFIIIRSLELNVGQDSTIGCIPIVRKRKKITRWRQQCHHGERSRSKCPTYGFVGTTCEVGVFPHDAHWDAHWALGADWKSLKVAIFRTQQIIETLKRTIKLRKEGYNFLNGISIHL